MSPRCHPPDVPRQPPIGPAHAIFFHATGVDTSVLRLGYSYNDAGLPYQQTSYSTANGTGTPVDQDQESYNGYGQLLQQWQADSGSVNTGSTPSIQYGFSQPTGANYSRLSSMTYPNGRVLDYAYNTGIDSTISRVSALKDDAGTYAGTDQSYTYLDRWIKGHSYYSDGYGNKNVPLSDALELIRSCRHSSPTLGIMKLDG